MDYNPVCPAWGILTWPKVGEFNLANGETQELPRCRQATSRGDIEILPRAQLMAAIAPTKEGGRTIVHLPQETNRQTGRHRPESKGRGTAKVTGVWSWWQWIKSCRDACITCMTRTCSKGRMLTVRMLFKGESQLIFWSGILIVCTLTPTCSEHSSSVLTSVVEAQCNIAIIAVSPNARLFVC